MVLFFYGFQAIEATIAGVLLQRKQVARFGIEEKEQAIKQNERIVVNLLIGFRRWRQAIRFIFKKTLRDITQRKFRAGLEDVFQRKRTVLKRAAPEEGIKVQKGFDIRFQQRGQINLVGNLQFMGGVRVIQPPFAPISEDVPGQTAVRHLEKNLVRGIFVAERVAASACQRLIQRAIPGFRIAYRECALP